jgi:protein O-GlcNAc transferase
MKKVISFCLWGSDPRYTVGALRNAQLARDIYPDWICRYYIAKCVPAGIVNNLFMMNNTEIIITNEPGDWNGMFWRFYAASDPHVDIMISRDTDSRLNHREKAAVDEWLAGEKDFHIMRDHPAHDAPIMGGMWGVRNRLLFNMADLISQFPKGDFWQVDQNFLRSMVYPLVREHACVHDEYFEKQSFPTVREGGHDEEGNPMTFVGQVFNENDVDSRIWDK